MLRRNLFGFFSAPALTALVPGLLATVTLFTVIGNYEYERIEAEFKRRAGNRIAAVKSGLDEAVEALAVINRLFVTAQPISREQFRQFTLPILERNPHLRLVTYHRLITHAERPTFEEERRKQFPGFTITEFSGGKLVPAGIRKQYRVIDFLEPMSGNEAAFGLDAFSRNQQDETMRRACETGHASMTPQYRLVLDDRAKQGFVILMPVYRSGTPVSDPQSRCLNVVGYTTAAMVSADLVEKTLAARGLLRSTGFDISVYASGTADEKNLAFRTGAPPGGTSTLPGSVRWMFGGRPDNFSETFDVAGRPWHIVVSPAPVPFFRHHLGSFLMLIGGILTSVLAAGYLHMLAARSRNVQKKVDERTEDLMRANQLLQLRQQAIEACVNGIIITGATEPDYPIEYVNPAFERLSGYSAAEVIGRSCSMLWGNDYRQAGVKEITAMARERREVNAVLRTYRKDGTMFWSEVHVAPVKNADGHVHHFVVAHYDITEKKRYEEELEYQANHDTLTGLANRNLLRDRLRQAITQATRDGHSVWVMFIDLDRFKYINDSLGHHAGDEFLKTMSDRLRSVVRASDTVARLGGDEFLLVLPDQAEEPLTTAAVQRVMETIAKPVTIEGHELFLSCSAGIAVYPADGDDPDVLVENADLAMYRAKELGRNNFQFYTSAMNDRAQERLQIEGALRTALDRSEFRLFYQPQVDLCTGYIVGMEALLRWQHPEMGTVQPSRFISVAEESGLIVQIGAWVMQTACRQAQTWRTAGLGDLRIAVNLSVRQFAQPDLVQMVSAILDESGLPARYLDLEITESMIMTDVERAVGVLNQLRELGVKLSVDDFGTGYSSLSYLKRFPIDVLKIDRSFVQEISQHTYDAAIPDAIISMAHSLGIRVIAEGVETELQCEFLSRNMCDEIQGYLFSAALAADDMEALLREAPRLPEHLLRMHKRQRTLLLVDDEPNILGALRRQLRGAGYQILTAGSGQEGLSQLEKHEVDVIISDQRMPGMTGVEFLRTVKQLYPDTVRIVLSGFTELQSVTDAVNEGAIYKFLTKPWDDAQLCAHIQEAFQHKEMADENRRLSLEVRTANHGLAQANRQLESVLRQKQAQISSGEVALDVVREALQYVPTPMIGLDEDEVVAFANVAAQELFKDAGMLFGSDAVQLMPEVLDALRGVAEGQPCIAEIKGRRFEIVCRTMGKDTQSRGRLIMMTPGELADFVKFHHASTYAASTGT
ncbi:MAG TPA: EAL domain-containing protein [Noviherbaspirillum sp.]|nr:EAL domain-containing protein [Noviherbaspirillum sp.]